MSFRTRFTVVYQVRREARDLCGRPLRAQAADTDGSLKCTCRGRSPANSPLGTRERAPL